MNFTQILQDLETGKVRAAYKNEQGVWQANIEVKQAILASFKAGKLVSFANDVDKDTIPPQKFSPARNIRIVPTGSSVRSGAYVAEGVIIMPPSYINIGAFVDSGTLVDSHVLVGSCAQIGKNVHLSAGVQIGGVLEPIGASPVIIEDNAFIGAGSVIVEGITVGEYAVIAPGVVLSKAIPVYDCIQKKILKRGSSIPPYSVVVPATRKPSDPWAVEQGLSLSCAMIIKYRDEKSNASLTLEEALR